MVPDWDELSDNLLHLALRSLIGAQYLRHEGQDRIVSNYLCSVHKLLIGSRTVYKLSFHNWKMSYLFTTKILTFVS